MCQLMMAMENGLLSFDFDGLRQCVQQLVLRLTQAHEDVALEVHSPRRPPPPGLRRVAAGPRRRQRRLHLAEGTLLSSGQAARELHRPTRHCRL
jgi:hypothetical protein